MWNRMSGKSSDTKDDVSSPSTRRNGDESRSTKRPSGSGSGTVVSSSSDKKTSSRGDDRDRGFNPTSTSYSSTSRSPYPGTASASVASSYATAGRNDDEIYVPPGLVRNASLADQMPKSRSSRSSRETGEDLDSTDRKREKKEKREKKNPDGVRDRGISRPESGFGRNGETTRGSTDFPDQIGSAGFSQFPGQYDGAIPGSSSSPPDHPSMSSHVQDQFPGQFPKQSTEPYRPPLAASDGGPGLAAEYYGDAGQSVHEQPGFRKHSPSMIVNAEPHLLPASVASNPPPEPSASGGVGAAASFFSGSFEDDETVSSHGLQQPSTYSTAPSRPDNHHSSSTPPMPIIGGAAMGAAAGYFMDSQSASQQQRPEDAQSVAGAQSEHASTTYRPPSHEAQDSYYSNGSRPSKPGKPSSQSSNIPIYAAGAAGAAGLAAAAYQQSHHSSSQQASSIAPYPNHTQHPSTPMMQRHRHRGPFSALVDFFKDPDGVAQFEEYSEITGVCRYCFEPGSSPRDAPRRHRYSKRRSNERLGSGTRIDKDSRYYSSENEHRRNKDKSWLATGLAGYGLAKVGETLFKQQNDFDDTYSVKTGRYSPDGRSQKSRRRSQSNDRVVNGITSDDKIYKDSQGDILRGPNTTTYSTRRRPRSRSRSRERKSNLTDAALGAAVGTSVAGSASQRRSRSPKGAIVRTSHKARSRSPERRRRSHKKKKEKGFFNFGGSSSSSSVDVGRSEKRGSSKKSNTKSKDDRKAEAALLGLGAAAAALALNDSRQGHKKKGIKELVGGKETRDKYDEGHRNGYKPPKVSSRSSEDEGWESAAEDDHDSVDLGLAYGAPARRGSRESLSSDSSGTNKWGWRWGSKKDRRTSPPKRKSSEHSSIPAIAGTIGAGLTSAAMMSPDQYSGYGGDSTTSAPLQHVFPVPTSDPGRFDVGREGSVSSSSRPGVVPIQHPQPITPVSAALYSSQAPYEHSYSAPIGPPVFSQPPFQSRPTAIDARYSMPQYGIPGGLPQDKVKVKTGPEDFNFRRRDTSPARFGIDSMASSMAPRRQSLTEMVSPAVKAEVESVASAVTSRQRSSTKDDSSAVRFDLTEEQEEEARRERRRKKREEKQRREAEEQEQMDRDRRTSGDSSTKYDASKSDEKSSDKSWAAPVAVGVAGAAIGVAAAVESSKFEETRDERRERRRREREAEEAEDEDKSRRRERRRRERERENEESTSKETRELPDVIPEVLHEVDQKEPRAEQEKSVWQEAASAKTVHENYGDFFTPIELRNRSTDEVKVTSANADADIDLDRSPNIVAITPKGFRDPDALPEFSKADTDDRIDIKFPWQVAPRLRLVEPTPPSTRGSTPVVPTRSASDDDVEDLASKPSTSRVTWGDDQTHEYTVITPHDEREEIIDLPDESNDRDQADVTRSRDERKPCPDRKQQQQPANDTPSNNGPTSYSNDLEFAATLAASAEDAGFDPSIVIDDPAYRRRDSPPESNNRSMPGGFDDENEPKLSKKERKRKDKLSRRQSEDEPDGRNDSAIVQDIVSQVQASEPQDARPETLKEIDDEWETGKKSESRKSKKDRKDSGSRDESYETSKSMGNSHDPESRPVYESPTEDAQSVLSSAVSRKDVEGVKKSRKKSKRSDTDYDNVASTTSSRSTTEAFNDKPKEKKKESIWNRVLGKSTDSLPQENSTEKVIAEAGVYDFDEAKGKKKKSKERRSTRDDLDDDDTRSRASATSSRDTRRRSSAEGTAQDSGRIGQDLSTKDQKSSREPDSEDEQRPESFLGERPEPPPPPDIAAEENEPPDPAIAVSPPATPQALPDDQAYQYADFHAPEPLRSPSALPSPTAVPFHRHRPRPLPGSGRSLSQTPLSSTQTGPEIATQQKLRPRSTEFKSSKEFRPLWLVEKNMPRQEPAVDETYPSLPSSHTTTPASSVHDPEEDVHNDIGDYEMTEADHKPIEGIPELAIDTHNNAIPSDLLDSQQATPTASTFQHAPIAQDLPSLPASRASSPTFVAEESAPKTSATLRDAALGAVIGGTAATILHEASQPDDSARRNVSQEEDEQFQQGLDDMSAKSSAHRSFDEGPPATKPLPLEVDEHPDQSLGDVAPEAEANQPQEIDAFGEDFAPQVTKKGKKGKRKASKGGQTEEQSSIATPEIAPSKDMQPKSLSTEELRQIQERDAQDAVDSWFEPTASAKKDKKRNKKNSGFDEPLGDLDTTPVGIETPQDDNEQPEPKEVQKNGSLTQDMPRDQVVDIIATAAQSEKDDKTAPSEDAVRADQAPIENLLLRRQSKSKVKKGKKGRKNTLEEDMPPTPPAAAAVPKSVQFADPFSAQYGENLSQSRQANSAFEEGISSNERQPIATSPHFEISPMAIPLPIDNDLDLHEEHPRSPSAEAADQKASHEQESRLQDFSNTTAITEGITLSEQPREQSRDLSTQPEQEEPNDYFDLSSTKKGKKAKKAKQSSSTSIGTDAVIDDETSLPESAFSVVENNVLEAPTEKLAVDAPEGESTAVGNEWGGFGSKKRGQKSKANEVANLNAVANAEKEPPMSGPSANDNEQIRELVDEPIIDAPLEEAKVAEDDWGDFSTRKKGKKGRKTIESFTDEPSADLANNEVSAISLANPQTDTAEQTQKLVEEPISNAPQQDSREGEDEWAGFSTNKKGKKGKKQKARPFVVGAEPTEPEQNGLSHDQIMSIDDKTSTATTKTSQEVAGILQNDEVASLPGQNLDQTSYIDAEAHRELQEPEFEQPLDSHDGSVQSDFKPRNIAEPSETQYPDFIAQEAVVEATELISAHTAATTDTAKHIQAILKKDDSHPSMPRNEDVMDIPKSAVEEISADKPIQFENDEPDWNAPTKKKKGKKGKKSELYSFDEPESTAPVETYTPPVEVGRSVEEESASPVVGQTPAKKLIEDDEPDWAAPKKMKKGKKGKNSEILASNEPDISEPTEAFALPVQMESPAEQEPTIPDFEQPSAGQPVDEEQVDWAAPKKTKKGKKGRKSDLLSVEEPQDKEPSGPSTPLSESEPSIEREFGRDTLGPQDDTAIAPRSVEEPATEKAVKAVEPDWDAPRKIQGKKSKKNQTFAYDDVDNLESPAAAAPPSGLELPKMQQSETEVPALQEGSALGITTTEKPTSEQLVAETAPDWDAPKKKKSKKGKKNQVFAYDDLDPSESQATATPPIELEDAATLEPALEEVDDTRESKRGKKDKQGKKSEVVSFNEPKHTDSLGIFAPSVKLKSSVDREPIVEEADDFASKQPKKGKKSKRKSLSRTTSGFEDANENNDNNIAPVTLPEDAVITEVGPLAEPETVTTFANTIEEELISDKARELGPIQEGDFMPPKSKKDKKGKDKKGKEKGLSRSPTGFEDTREHQSDELRSIPPMNEVAPKVEQLEESLEPTDPIQAEVVSDKARELGPLQDDDFMPPKSKTDRKKAKNSRAFGWDDETAPTPESGPILETRSFGEAALDQTVPLGNALVEQPEDVVEDRPRSKKDPKNLTKSQPFSPDDDINSQAEEEVNSVMLEHDGKEPIHGPRSPDPAKALSARPPNDISSTPILSEHEPVAPEGLQVKEVEDKDIESSIDPNVHVDAYPLFIRKNSKKVRKEARQAEASAWEEDEVREEPKEVSEASATREKSNGPAIASMPKNSDEWSRRDQLTELTEPTEVIEPDDEPLEAQRHGPSSSELQSSRETIGLDPLLLVDRDDDLAPARKSKKGKKKRKDAQRAQDEYDIVEVPIGAGPEAARDALDTEPEPLSEARIQAPISPAKDSSIPAAEIEMLDDKEQREYDRKYSKELDRQDTGDPQAFETNVLPLQAEEGHHEPQEQAEYREHYAEAEMQGEESSTTPATDSATPAMEVEMLDPQEQREYDNEYARELERQLSPLEDEEPAITSSQSSGSYDAATSKPSIDTLVEQPLMERPYEDVHRHLAQAPDLEDIMEEPRSRSGSIQESPADREDDVPSFKSTKKNKKSKKGKKQQQPVIWEDETATPPVDEETERVAHTPIETLDVLGSWKTGAPSRPIDLEEHIEHEPIGMTPSAERGPSTAHDNADDYFAIQPSRGAEEDVGMQHRGDLERSISTEQPRIQSPRWEQHPGQVENMYQEEPRDEHTHDVESSQTDLLEPSRSESMLTVNPVDDESSYAPTKKSKKSKKSKRKEIEEEPSFSTLSPEGHVQSSSYPNVSVHGYEDESSASRERSSQRSPRNGAEQKSRAEEQSRSASRSRNTDRLAAAGLGIGAIAAEGISRRDSKKEGKNGKKGKRVGRQVAFEEEPRATESPSGGEEPMIEHSRQDLRPERQDTTSAWLQTQVMPSQPPPPHTYPENLASESTVQHVQLPSGGTPYRDSAIHVSDSPILMDDSANHRHLRDSGYPDTETSPIVAMEPQDHGMHAPRDAGDYDDGALEKDIIDEYDQGTRKSNHLTAITGSEKFRDPEDSHDGEAEHEIIDQDDEDSRRTEHGRWEPEDALNVPVDVDPSYDVSVSTPKEKTRRRRSKRRSGAGYDSDDSADSGFDIRRRRRLQAKVDDPREPSPVSSTTKDRSSALFGSSPSAREETLHQANEHQTPSRTDPAHKEPTRSFGQQESPQGQSRASESNRSPFDSEQFNEPSTYEKLTGHHEPPPSLFGGPLTHDDDVMSHSMSPPSSDIRGRKRLNTISEDGQERSSLHKKDKRADSDVGSPEAGVKERRTRSPPTSEATTGQYISTDDLISSQPWPTVDEDKHSIDLERSRSRGTDQPSSRQSNTPNPAMFPAKYRESERKTSNTSAQSENSIHAIIRTPDQVRSASGQSFRSSGTPPLRRVDRSASGDLRGASKLSEAKSRAKDFEAEPDINIPSSSTYDPVTDKGKNRADMADIYEAYGNARGQSPMSPTRPPSMRKRQSMQLLDLETRLDQLVSENRLLQSQRSTAERSLQDQARDHSQQRHAYEEAMQEHKMFLLQKDSELNELKQILEDWQSKVTHLTEVNDELSSRGMDEDHHQRYRDLETEHADLREQHTQLSTGMESIVQHEVAAALEEKNLELRQLRNELDNAKQQVRNLQQQLLTSRASDDFVERDDDYFDGQCQALCQHVQQWVLRFSKFSDMKACYRASEVRDEKVVDRMENALLDGSDFDECLQDRVKRRDVFMSVVMTMIWEFIFTRYLFGMDREQRQKLKNLEKTLQEVGPMPAVHKWRATTLTLLMKRQSFENQRETDTEAVVHEIYDTLATFLPPPSHLVSQIQDSLRKVINAAVDLSIEMRTQRADYQMLPPLVPEYDTNGDLVGKVRFNALTMNERSDSTSSNEVLEEQEAVVRMVLFPLVVRTEEDDEQIVVCPAQVLTAQGAKGKKSVRVMSAQGGRSEASFGGSEGGMI